MAEITITVKLHLMDDDDDGDDEETEVLHFHSVKHMGQQLMLVGSKLLRKYCYSPLRSFE